MILNERATKRARAERSRIKQRQRNSERYIQRPTAIHRNTKRYSDRWGEMQVKRGAGIHRKPDTESHTVTDRNRQRYSDRYKDTDMRKHK